jgi:hypothetical protein
LEGIVSIFDEWLFDGCHQDEDPIGFFVAKDGAAAGRIMPTKYTTIFPTTRPFRWVVECKDGRRVPLADAPPDEDGLDEEIIELAEISNRVASLMTGGRLELVAVGHYTFRNAYFEKLTIRSDGRVECYSQHFDSFTADNWSEQQSDKFDPSRRSECLKERSEKFDPALYK